MHSPADKVLSAGDLLLLFSRACCCSPIPELNMDVHCSLQGYSLSFPTESTKISLQRDQSGLDCLLLWDLQVLSMIGGVYMVLLGVDLGFGGRVFPSCINEPGGWR